MAEMWKADQMCIRKERKQKWEHNSICIVEDWILNVNASGKQLHTRCIAPLTSWTDVLSLSSLVRHAFEENQSRMWLPRCIQVVWPPWWFTNLPLQQNIPVVDIILAIQCWYNARTPTAVLHVGKESFSHSIFHRLRLQIM